jgi:DNA replication and repair protein RecF
VFLHSLRTAQWRNVEDGEIDFAPGVNVLVGSNGQGKTNVLEAVQYLALGRSHRGSRDEELVRFGSSHFYVRGVGRRDAGETFEIEAGFAPPRSKRLKVDAQPVARLTDLVGVLACVAFGPEDSELSRGGPQARRRYVDYALAETSSASLQLLGDYRRVVQQRNALLRASAGRAVDLEVWDQELVRLGHELVARRAEALADLAPRAQAAFATLAGDRRMTLSYRIQAIDASVDLEADTHSLQAMLAGGEFDAGFRGRLQQRRGAEVARQQSLVGPHRDDIELRIDGLDVRRFGSQGQSRAAAVALKIAQADFIRARRGERPIVVLDDVFAELDDARAATLWSMVCEHHQTFLAVPRRGDLGLGRGDAVFEVRAGRVERAA